MDPRFQKMRKQAAKEQKVGALLTDWPAFVWLLQMGGADREAQMSSMLGA